jgi:hypothetical protein
MSSPDGPTTATERDERREGAGHRVLFVAGVVILAALAGLAGIMVARFGNAQGYPMDSLHQGVNPANLQLTPMFVVRRGDTVWALRPFVPESTDAVAWCPRQGFFESPVTGAKFAINGDYLAGPAPRGLDAYDTTIVGGDVLQVTPSTVHFGLKAAEQVPADHLPACDWSAAQFPPNVARPGSPTPETPTP